MANQAVVNPFQQGGSETESSSSFNCPCCSSSFTEELDYFIHLKTVHNGKPFTCLICKKGFSTKGNLDYHQQLHGNESFRFGCPHCEKRFRRNCALQAHIKRMHLSPDERDFGCYLCPKKFVTMSKLIMHLERYHSVLVEKPFKCQFCPKTFVKEAFREVHMVNLHNVEPKKKFQCRECGIGFIMKSSYTSHMNKEHSKLIVPNAPAASSVPELLELLENEIELISPITTASVPNPNELALQLQSQSQWNGNQYEVTLPQPQLLPSTSTEIAFVQPQLQQCTPSLPLVNIIPSTPLMQFTTMQTQQWKIIPLPVLNIGNVNPNPPPPPPLVLNTTAFGGKTMLTDTWGEMILLGETATASQTLGTYNVGVSGSGGIMNQVNLSGIYGDVCVPQQSFGLPMVISENIEIVTSGNIF